MISLISFRDLKHASSSDINKVQRILNKYKYKNRSIVENFKSKLILIFTSTMVIITYVLPIVLVIFYLAKKWNTITIILLVLVGLGALNSIVQNNIGEAIYAAITVAYVLIKHFKVFDKLKKNKNKVNNVNNVNNVIM